MQGKREKEGRKGKERKEGPAKKKKERKNQGRTKEEPGKNQGRTRREGKKGSEKKGKAGLMKKEGWFFILYPYLKKTKRKKRSQKVQLSNFRMLYNCYYVNQQGKIQFNPAKKQGTPTSK